jgi:L-rhamnonate dehydratase
MFYGRKGITLATISVIDLAIWDLLGKIRGEPVYKMIGGRTKKEIPFYCTGPTPPDVSAAEASSCRQQLPGVMRD